MPQDLLSVPQKWQTRFPHPQQRKIPRVRTGCQGISTRRNVMKTLHYVYTKLIIVAMGFSVAAGAPTQARGARSNSAGARSDNAYLIVNRAANFGTRESINLFIDGVQVAVLGLNQSYEGVLRPGKHLLSMTTNPRTEGLTRLTQRSLDARPGETYPFTALWDDSHHASLENDAPLWQKVL